MKRKIIASIVILAISAGLYLSSGHSIPYLDKQANRYFAKTLTMAGIAYGGARAINAIVSVIKESEVSINLGAGVSIAAGQILDPLDDMTERLSSLLVMTIVSLGVQKIMMEIGGIFAFKIIAFLVLLLIIPIWKHGRISLSVSSLVLKVIIVLMVFRFFLPLSALVNNILYSQFLEPRINKVKEDLQITAKLDENTEDIASMFETEESDEGIWSKIKNFFNSIQVKVLNLLSKTKMIVKNLGDFINALLSLSILYLTLFIIQCLLIPITTLWLMIRIADLIFKTSFENRFLEKLKGKKGKIETQGTDTLEQAEGKV